MKKAVMYGAGKIGRGFLGELFCSSGYETIFIDVDQELVSELNREKRYPITYTDNKGNCDVWVTNIRAVDGQDTSAVAREIASCHILATAVGAGVLKHIAASLARGIEQRVQNVDADPLNIIICENLIDGASTLKKLIAAELKIDSAVLDTKVGFVEASVGRMVPVMDEEKKNGIPLRVCVEPYRVMPVDRDGFCGNIPEIEGMKAYSDFDFYIQRKLYIHNMGHSLIAYLGDLAGYTYIWQALENEAVRRIVREAMLASAQALSKAHHVPFCEIESYVADLLARFSNRALGDTVARVGRDLDRKLSAADRMAGAVRLCREQGVSCLPIMISIAAALRFSDSQPGTTAKLLAANDPERILSEISKLDQDSVKDILTLYSLLNIKSG